MLCHLQSYASSSFVWQEIRMKATFVLREISIKGLKTNVIYNNNNQWTISGETNLPFKLGILRLNKVRDVTGLKAEPPQERKKHSLYSLKRTACISA